MKQITLTMIAILVALLILTLWMPTMGQNTQGRLVKTLTVAGEGSQTLTSYGKINKLSPETILGGSAKDININWQFTDAASVGSQIHVSSETGQTFVSWWLNNVRISLYENTSAPVWENNIGTHWEWPIDMTENGEWLASGYDSVAQVFNKSSSSLFWEKIVDGKVLGVKLSPDGTKLYIARNYNENSYVEGFTVGQLDPDWTVPFSGKGTVFTGSGDGSKLIFCQYLGVNKMWVLDSDNGNIIFDAFYYNHSKPACSYNGNILVNGDFRNNVHAYEYDETNNTYFEKWNYKVGGGGTHAWIQGMAVSGDGSAIAVGTLIFLSNGNYDGEIYLFNASSPIPLWVFHHAGDDVSGVDFTYDGSLLAACGWGPMDNSTPDFWIFRKESVIPIFTINTPGSFNTVDISPDGTLCAVTGKAVHNRVFGYGGFLYNIDSNPDGGTISGTVDLTDTTNEENVKIEVNELQYYFAYSNPDGSYKMKYIPAGTYSVTASKVGYFPDTIENVSIVEGDTSNLDFTLEETGNPPYGLSATQGAGLSVLLNWNIDSAQNFEGFNIYRKYIPEDRFPETPIATLPNTAFSFEDTDVLPMKDYYYAVTAIIEDNIETPYSNMVHGWMSDGFVTGEISAYTGTTPEIDGIISPGEWDDAFKLDASDFLGKYDNIPNPVGSVTMYFKTNPDHTELYVACINENDTVLEDHDEVALYIDDNNDGTYPPPGDDSEGNFWAAHYASGNVIKYRPIHNNGSVGDVFYLENPQIEVSDVSGHVVYEFMIPIGSDENWQINPNAENQSGLFLFVLDNPSSFDGYWPCWNPVISYPYDYGEITFGTTDEVPPPPEDMAIAWTEDTEVKITLEWSQPDINDFDHFNIYSSDGNGEWNFLDSTIGRQFLYSTTENYIEFYVTTVDHSEQESSPSDTVIYDITVGITEVSQLPETFIYPNPSSGTVNISMQIVQAGEYTLKILNSQGQLVTTLYSGHLPTGAKTISWKGINSNINHIPPGIYFVQLKGEGVQSTSKIVLLAD